MKFDLSLLEKTLPQIGAEKYRNYYIPFGSPSDSIKKEESDRVDVISKWKFSYYPYFTEKVLTDKLKDNIVTPSCWQILGYDYNQYTNTHYPIPYNPPFVNRENPCGMYQTEYTLSNKSGKYYLVLDGVDSAYYLFVNGDCVGYATGSHLYHEFDLTDKLNEGENIIKVLVFKWNAFTYIEDQDKLRMSGIFRDVYMLRRPKDHVGNYGILTDYKGNTGNIKLNFDKKVNLSLYDGEKVVYKGNGNKFNVDIENVKLWTAETPNLYRAVIEYNGEFITEFIGIRNITIEGKAYKINGKPVKFKGVNRHSSTKNGYAESLEDIELDLKIMREHNVNAIRTSHYMPHPYLPLLCDKYGIYLLEECDIESHGDAVSYGFGYIIPNWNRISGNKAYLEGFLDRAENMFERDKNRPSIIMWSLGNEAGQGNNLVEMSNYLRRVDKERPIHYEGFSKVDQGEEYVKLDPVDVCSHMYPSPKLCAKLIKDKRYNKPFILCEYSHAMGNAGGDLKDYWDVLYSSDNCVGGFIWEYCDHAVVTKDGKNLYGGDFGDFPNQTNFCVDGLVDCDRKFIHSEFKEAKEQYAPVDVKYKDGKYKIINRYDFISLDKVDCSYRVEVNGIKVRDGKLDLSGIPARKSKAFTIDVSVKEYTTVIFEFRIDGYLIATRQVILSDSYNIEKSNKHDSVKIDISEKTAKIITDSAKFVIGRKGCFESIITDRELLKAPCELKIVRAFTDNDSKFNKPAFLSYKMKDILNHAEFYTKSMKANGNKLFVDGRICINTVEWAVDVKIVYSFYDGGRVNIDTFGIQRFEDVERRFRELGLKGEELYDVLTRFGYEMPFAEGFKKVNYFGRGEEECYEDKKLLSVVSRYSRPVEDMYVLYAKPQEGGSHCDSREVELIGKNYVKCYSEKDFSFSIAPCKVSEYPTHRHEMKNMKGRVLNIDYRQRGIGTAVCGNEPAKDKLITEKEMKFNFDLFVK